MNIKEFDKVLLKNGFYAYIVDVSNDGKSIIADIDTPAGLFTEDVSPDTIVNVIPYDTWINESK